MHPMGSNVLFVASSPVRDTTTRHILNNIKNRCNQTKREVRVCKQQHLYRKQIVTSSTNDEGNELSEERNFLVSDELIQEILDGTMLSNKQLGCIYNSGDHGFDNEKFFKQLQPIDGVPSLVLGKTIDGILFGGYTSHGFAARDDYREATTEKGLFVFCIRDGRLVVANPSDRVLYDFYDYAIRFGAGSLGIPMNPDKHIMKSNVATSSCVLSDGSTSVFGEFTMATLEYIEVLVAQQYIDEINASVQKETRAGGLFGRFFGAN